MGKIKHSIQELQKVASERGGKCLSDIYLGIDKKHDWICNEGHNWNSTPHNVLRGTWCPICSEYESLSERICRIFFEKIFKAKFPKTKPKWLRNSKGNLMELDGYNEKLKIAFEYQGRQHYKSRGIKNHK